MPGSRGLPPVSPAGGRALDKTRADPVAERPSGPEAPKAPGLAPPRLFEPGSSRPPPVSLVEPRRVGALTSIAAAGLNLETVRLQAAEMTHAVAKLHGVANYAALVDGTADVRVPHASFEGLFAAGFGRDQIEAAKQGEFPRVQEAVLLNLASKQGRKVNPRTEEEPGRIFHEERPAGDPVADEHLLHKWSDDPAVTRGVRLRYFGAVDPTPNFVNLAAQYRSAVGAEKFSQLLGTPMQDPDTGAALRMKGGQPLTFADALGRAAGWCLSRMNDPRGGGYVWIQRSNPQGIEVQGWRDSRDGVHRADGTPYSDADKFTSAEVVGYTYDALHAMADILASHPAQTASVDQALREAGLPPEAANPSALRERAEQMREAFVRDFWLPDKKTFAMSFSVDDGVRVAQPVLASNAGHLLASKILDGPDLRPKVEAMVGTLMGPDLLAEEGILTLGRREARYRPGAYHQGSVWPHDTGIVAQGLERHGFHAEAEDLKSRIVRANAAVRNTPQGQRAHAAEGVGYWPEFYTGVEPGEAPQVNSGANRVVIDPWDGKPNTVWQEPQNQAWALMMVHRIYRERGWLDLGS
jgi:glycogen debranching enzyme